MASIAAHRRLVGSLALLFFTIGLIVCLVQVVDARLPASNESVVAAMNREIASVLIANHTFTFSTVLHTKDRDGAAEVVVSCWWPREARANNVGEALREFSLNAEALCRRFGRRFDSTYGSEVPNLDQQTQRYRVDLRYWISKPSLK